MAAASVPTGTKRCCEIQGQERHQGNPAELTPKRYPNMTNRRGVVCPVLDTMGLFQAACMPLPIAMLRLPISSTAKVMYARLLDATLAGGAEDTNGILFVRFPIVELAAALSRSSVTVKRSLKELEDAGLILRVRRGVGEPNRIYTLLPKKEGCRDE